MLSCLVPSRAKIVPWRLAHTPLSQLKAGSLFSRVLYKAPVVLLVSLELDGSSFSPADVPHDHGVIGAA